MGRLSTFLPSGRPARARLRTAANAAPVLFVTVACAWLAAGSAGTAMAQQDTGTVNITDLDDGKPITATQVGGTNQVNDNLTADMNTPETIGSSFPIDGLVTGGTGYSVLLEQNGMEVSDLLQVTVTPKVRGNNINYFDASWTFTSDTDPMPIDLSTLGLSDETIAKIIAAGQLENGKQQGMTGNLLDANGNPLNVGGLFISAASFQETPEPGGMAFLAAGLLCGAAVRRKLRVRSKFVGRLRVRHTLCCKQ